MKILYVHAKGEVAGSDISLLTILKNLNKKLFTPNLIVAKKGPLFNEYQRYCQNCKEVNLSVLKTPDSISEFFKMILVFIPSIFTVWSVIRKWKIDIVHVNSTVMPAAVIAGKLAGKSVIVHNREIITSNIFIGKILDIISYIFADKVIAISNAVKNNSSKILQNKTTVIYNGVDVNEIRYTGENRTRKSYNIPSNVYLIGTFSRIEPWKGQNFVIESMPKVLSEIPNVKLIIFGKPYTKRGEVYLNYLKTLVEKLGIKNSVIFGGSSKTFNDTYCDFDLVILPSVEPEPLGRVVIEAMMAERPIISTNIGGVKEFIENDKTGVLIEPRDIEGMSYQIIRLLKSVDLRKSLAEKARKYSLENFDMTDIIRSIDKIYKELA